MRIGNLVAVRFDDSVAIGILTAQGKWKVPKGHHTFLYVSGKDLIPYDSLPRTRFIQLTARFTNLCDLSWEDVNTEHINDVFKLNKWMSMPNQEMGK